MPAVIISHRGVDRLRGGHPWIYRSDILRAEAEPGDLVDVVSERGRPLAVAFWSSASQIALRVLRRHGDRSARAREREVAPPSPDGDPAAALMRDRLVAAMAYRQTLQIEDTAWRLVNAESDGLPGLIVDRYADWLVVQTLVQATDRRLALITALLAELVQPRGILARNDPRVRRLEGLEEQVAVVFGDVPDTVEVLAGGIRQRVDLRHGQKTGLFLDQRENHRAASAYTTGRALDAFCYQGGFALQMARKAEQVIALDSSAPALRVLQDTAAMNAVSNVETREVNVFDELRELEVSGERFDTIVLDPPAFAKNKAAVPRAVAGYKEINLRAFKLLRAGGHLVTCSCSYNVDQALFLHILEQAAADAQATVALVEQRQQARDHPVLLGVPETHYLKCMVLRRVG